MATLTITNKSFSTSDGVIDPFDLETNLDDVETFHNGNNIEDENFLDLSIPSGKIASDAVDTDKPIAASILQAKLADDCITNTALSANVVQDRNIDWRGGVAGRMVRLHATSGYRPMKIGRGTTSNVVMNAKSKTVTILWAAFDDGDPSFSDPTGDVVVFPSPYTAGGPTSDNNLFEVFYEVTALGIDFRITSYGQSATLTVLAVKFWAIGR